VRTKFKALGANVFRICIHRKKYGIYFTANGIVLNIHKLYWYWNTGRPFHKKALAVTDIRGDESVETKYIRPKWRVWQKDINYGRPNKMRRAA